jgi:TatA/E family protein of Tat protein translocase
MFGLQPTHLIVIFFVVLLLLVPSRLPDLVRGIGKAVKEFRFAINEKPTETLDKPTQSPASSSEENSSNDLRRG